MYHFYAITIKLFIEYFGRIYVSGKALGRLTFHEQSSEGNIIKSKYVFYLKVSDRWTRGLENLKKKRLRRSYLVSSNFLLSPNGNA